MLLITLKIIVLRKWKLNFEIFAFSNVFVQLFHSLTKAGSHDFRAAQPTLFFLGFIWCRLDFVTVFSLIIEIGFLV